MPFGLLADAVVVVHFGFVLFVIFGGFLVLRWRRAVFLHVPSILWAAFIEFYGGVCPLTPLENWLRRGGGVSGYESGFIENYLIPVLYPSYLTREIQIVLGVSVIALNFFVYGWVCLRKRKA
jgi:hypothetical protein